VPPRWFIAFTVPALALHSADRRSRGLGLGAARCTRNRRRRMAGRPANVGLTAQLRMPARVRASVTGDGRLLGATACSSSKVGLRMRRRASADMQRAARRRGE